MTSLSFKNRARSDPSRVLASVGILKNGESRVRAETPLMMSGRLLRRKTRLPMAHIDAIIAETRYKANQILFTLYTGDVNSVHILVDCSKSITIVSDYDNYVKTSLNMRVEYHGKLI